LSSESYYPGMEIHATVLSNLLKKHFIIQPASWIKYIIVLLLSFLSPVFFLRYPKVISSIIIISFSVILLFGLNYYMFYFHRIDISLIAPELALILSFILTGYINYVREGRHKNEIKRIFSRYISPEVVNELVKNYEDVELGGKEIEATVFFSDIKNFTSIAENLSPKELVQHLNNYLTIASGVILDQKAMLDKFIGDAIMAIFGVPIKVENHALSACIAALEIQKLLKEDYENNAHLDSPYFSTRIGLNTGKMIVGNIGSASRTDYTAIGDSVNIASRLEGINKIYGTQIIISESTYQEVKTNVVARELDELKVKGKQLPLKIYELIAIRGNESDETLKIISLFGEGLENYRHQNWIEAKQKFSEVLKIDENDGPSKMYIDRCNILENNEISPNWDGIYIAQNK
jgi:adenylate cyclase